MNGTDFLGLMISDPARWGLAFESLVGIACQGFGKNIATLYFENITTFWKRNIFRWLSPWLRFTWRIMKGPKGFYSALWRCIWSLLASSSFSSSSSYRVEYDIDTSWRPKYMWQSNYTIKLYCLIKSAIWHPVDLPFRLQLYSKTVHHITDYSWYFESLSSPAFMSSNHYHRSG